MKTVFKILTLIGFLLIAGIIGGIDCGEPLRNAWWCFPIGIFTILCAIIGGLIEIEIERKNGDGGSR